jgi:hypothetical protein
VPVVCPIPLSFTSSVGKPATGIWASVRDADYSATCLEIICR